jgi:uncharacterized protein
MMEFLSKPWPWYISGPLIGLTVPVLLLIGNKTFGVSSSLRHVCAACIPSRIPYFQYNWKKEVWNLFFVAGIIAGGLVVMLVLKNPEPVRLNPKLVNELQQYGISNYKELVPVEIFNWSAILSLKGFIMIVAGGFLVGFGTRYAGGCTSGHAIMGLSNLQWPSLVATICFMAGGFLVANFILPYILKL